MEIKRLLALAVVLVLGPVARGQVTDLLVGCSDHEYSTGTSCSTCSNPNSDEYVVQACTADADTVIESCTQSTYANEGKYTTKVCDPGHYGATGSDTEFGDCYVPQEGVEFTTAVCVSGDSDHLGSNTVYDDCKTPASDYSEYVAFPCETGRYNRLGMNTITASCDTPENTEYVQSACVIGSTTEKGSNAVINSCSSVPDGSYAVAACVEGTVSSAGANTDISKCTAAPVADDDTDEGTFVHADCVSGDWNEAGSDLIVEDCAAYSKCPTIGQESCEELCDFMSQGTLNKIITIAVIAGLLLVWCVYIWLSAPGAEKPWVIESATNPGDYVVCLYGTDVEGKLKRGIFVEHFENAEGVNFILDKNKGIRNHCLFYRQSGGGFRVSSQKLYWGHYEKSLIAVEPISEMISFEEVPALNGQEGAVSLKTTVDGTAHYLRAVWDGDGTDAHEGELELQEESDDEQFLNESAWVVSQWQPGSGFENYGDDDDE